jgi:hypothetical protein
MTVRAAADGTIELIGICPSGDAEALLQLLLADAAATVDWGECTAAHTAVVQVLMALRPKLRGSPANAHLREWVAPAITYSVA